MSTTLAAGTVVLAIEDNGYITDASDWAILAEASHNPTSAIACRVTYNGQGDYGLEYYYKPVIPNSSSVQPTTPEPGWGAIYGGPSPSYWTPVGPVWMFRNGQRVRFYDTEGQQVGPEQGNVGPAVYYATSQLWASPAALRMTWA